MEFRFQDKDNSGSDICHAILNNNDDVNSIDGIDSMDSMNNVDNLIVLTRLL